MGETKDMHNKLIDFSGLVLGFSSAALTYLGFIKTAGDKSAPINLSLAEQNIEILAILEQKTLGNLTAEESSLLKSALTDLRVRFVEVAKRKK